MVAVKFESNRALIDGHNSIFCPNLDKGPALGTIVLYTRCRVISHDPLEPYTM